MTPTNQNTFSGIVLLIGVMITCTFVAALFDSKAGEIAGAVGNVVGGIVGALGAAFAVYLTLTLQRKDEADRASSAIITEIAHLAKYPCGQLENCRAIFQGRFQPPRNSLAAMMQTPRPALYQAAAGLISRVPKPALVVAFYLGLGETEQAVKVILSAPSVNLHLTPTDVEGLGVLLINQCFLARQILSAAPTPTGDEALVVAAMLAGIMKMLDDELALSRPVFPTALQYQHATTP